jgi:carbon-monoxide dehydrogenase medium subunit
MIPAAFDYVAASSVDEAISLLGEHGEDSKLLAGGHSLIPLLKLRLATPSVLIDIGRIPDLDFIRDAGDHVAVGALTRHVSLQDSSLLTSRVPLLAEAAGLVGDMQVRNRGTIGGSLAHADPASDLPAVVVALNGTIVARGPGGERNIAAQDFFQDIWTSALNPLEVVTEIRIPYPPNNTAQKYEKFSQRSADWALVGVAVSVTRANGSIANASVVLTNVGATPLRAKGVEDALRGQPANSEAIQVASERASDGLDPSPELKASPDYKRHLARILTRRALQASIGG